jgi:molybdenum-dependent DNA-binding transcriptional regulator ModE
MAAIQLDTLAGEIKLAESAWDGFVLSVEDGEGSISKAVRSIIGSVTDLFSALTEINEVTDEINIAATTGGSLAGGNILGDILDMVTNTGEAVAIMRTLKKVLGELEGSENTVEDLTAAFDHYNAKLLETHKSETVEVASLEFMLGKIKELIVTKKDQIKTDQDLADKLAEQKEVLIDLLLEVDKSLDSKELDKKSTKELTALLNKYNSELEKQSEILDGSIESLKAMIKANSEIIEQTNDTTLRRKLQGENLLLAEQLKLMQAIPKAVESIKATSVGVVTLEDLAKRKAASGNKGTALAGGGSSDGPVSAAGLPGQTPFNFDLGDTGPSIFETALDDVVSFADKYEEVLGGAVDATNAFFDNRIERIQQDIDESNLFFENQIALAAGNEEQQVKLEKERQVKEKELQKKKEKELKKQALLQKGFAIAQITIDTARTIAGVLADAPKFDFGISATAAAITLGAIGAAQVAAVIAAPLPKFKDGTDAPLTKDTLAITGDGGKHEPITLGGKLIGVSPNTSTLTMLPKGAEVHKDFESLKLSSTFDLDAINKASVMASIYSDSAKLNAYTQAKIFDIALEKYHGGIEREIKRGLKKFKSNVTVNVSTEGERYANDTL